LVVVKKVVIAASAGGKFKTILQGSILGVMISPLDYYLSWLVPIEQVVLYLTLLVTVYTGLQYVVAAYRGTHHVK
jgi:phosphatidylglycerophosphate synthase